MIIYHGGTEIVEVPRIIKSDIGRDFGAGFYTTDVEDQAIRWAHRKALTVKRHNPKIQAILNIYEFDKTAYSKLNALHFPDVSADWIDMIVACRSDVNYSHEYDIVTGKIADDNVGETVQFVLKNVMRREDAVERLKFEKINNQICFCTEVALKFVIFKESRVV